MNIKCLADGRLVVWPEGWPVPQLGASVHVLVDSEPESFTVKRVVFHPEETEPFIVIYLQQREY